MLRFVLFATIAVGLAAAQTAVNATDLAAQLKASPTFAYLKCLDAITSVHDQYKNTSDFSLVAPVKFNTSLYYVACVTVVPPGPASVVESSIQYYLHPFLPVGKILSTIDDAGATLIPGATTAVNDAANAVLADDELFFASYPWNKGGIPPAAYTKKVIGHVVAGRGAEKGLNIACLCGAEQAALTA